MAKENTKDKIQCLGKSALTGHFLPPTLEAFTPPPRYLRLAAGFASPLPFPHLRRSRPAEASPREGWVAGLALYARLRRDGGRWPVSNKCD